MEEPRTEQDSPEIMGRDGEAALFSCDFTERYRWLVLHTRSHQEKAVASALAALEVDYFLPLVKQVRYYGRRKAMVEIPLFPGYVFVRGAEEMVYSIDRAKRLVGIIKVPIQRQLNSDLKNLHLASANKLALDPYPMLKSGCRVEVRAGPLRGLQGLIESRARPNRLVLQIEMLGQAVSTEVDASLLDLIN